MITISLWIEKAFDVLVRSKFCLAAAFRRRRFCGWISSEYSSHSTPSNLKSCCPRIQYILLYFMISISLWVQKAFDILVRKEFCLAAALKRRRFCGWIKVSSLLSWMIEAPREIFDWLMEILVPSTWSWHSGRNQRMFSFEFHNQTQPRMLCKENGAISHLQTEMGFLEDFC